MATHASPLINARHIIIHMLAIFFLHRAFIDIACLLHVDFLENMAEASGAKVLAERNKFLLYVGLLASIGSLTGFLVSGLVGIVKKWYWLNTLLAFISFWLLNNFVLSKVGISAMFGALGDAVGNLFFYYSFLAALMLCISLGLFFAKPVTCFIERYRKEEVPVSAQTNTLADQVK